MRRGRADEVTEEDVRLLLHLISCGKQVMNYSDFVHFASEGGGALLSALQSAAAVTEAARAVKRTRDEGGDDETSGLYGASSEQNVPMCFACFLSKSRRYCQNPSPGLS